jgi:hypothetical protein
MSATCSCGHPEDVHSFEYGCNTEDLRATPCGCTDYDAAGYLDLSLRKRLQAQTLEFGESA